MGVMSLHNPVPLGEVDDILRPSADANPLLDQGFVVTSVDALFNWGPNGFALAHDVWFGLLRR